jgi:hypothetical protein
MGTFKNGHLNVQLEHRAWEKTKLGVEHVKQKLSSQPFQQTVGANF